MTHARYCWLKAEAADARGEHAVASAERARAMEADRGTPLPDGFPLPERLLALHFFGVEDLLDLSIEDLIAAGFTPREADTLAPAILTLSP